MAFIIKREKFDRDVEEDMKFVKEISDALELMYKDGHPNVKNLILESVIIEIQI